MVALLTLVALQVPNTPPTASVSLPKLVAPHAAFEAKLTVTFASGLHGYQNPPSDKFNIPVTVKLLKGDAKVQSIKYPRGTDLAMAGEAKPTRVYSGTIVIPVRLVAGSKSGDLVMAVDYQQCTSSNCFPPASVQAKAALHVAKKKA